MRMDRWVKDGAKERTNRLKTCNSSLCDSYHKFRERFINHDLFRGEGILEQISLCTPYFFQTNIFKQENPD